MSAIKLHYRVFRSFRESLCVLFVEENEKFK